MRKVIRKRIRRSEDGVNLAADIDAVVSVNSGPGQVSQTVVRSRHSVVQGPGLRDQPETKPEDEDGPPKETR